MSAGKVSAGKVSAAALRAFEVAALRKLGFPPARAEQAADVLLEADLRGVESHGIVWFAGRVPEIQQGRLDPLARAVVVHESGAVARLDGQRGFGPLLCLDALEKAAELARTFGVGVAALMRSHHWGCPAYYTRSLAKRGFVAIGMTNTTGGMMPLWGSSAPTVGNNPLTIAAPRRDAEPVVLDIAMQQISWGGLRKAAAMGQLLPEPWGFDKEGKPTRDPREILASKRPRPMGDYKGSGLAFMIEILTGVLAGGLIPQERLEREAEGDIAQFSQLFIALSIPHFVDMETFYDKVERLYLAAKAAPPAEGVTEILLPGDRSNATMRERLEHGIPLDYIGPAIEKVAAALQLPLPWEGP